MPERLQFAVSSISCTEPGISLLSREYSTRTMIERAKKLQKELAPVLGENSMSLSLHLARTLDVPMAADLATQQKIKISSIDIPDIITIGMEWNGLIHDTESALHTKGIKGAIQQEAPRVVSRLGWYLTNVPDQDSADKKLGEGLEAIKNNGIPRIVRANMVYWTESSRGDRLRKQLSGYPNTILAVEMDPRNQTPQEYFRTLEKMAKTNDCETPVYADLDLGKFGQSKYQFHQNYQIPEPLELYEKFLAENPELVAATTLDQFVDGDVETHRQLQDGPTDLLRAAKDFGDTARQERLPFQPMIVIEFHPGRFDSITKPEGIHFFKQVNDSFKRA